MFQSTGAPTASYLKRRL